METRPFEYMGLEYTDKRNTIVNRRRRNNPIPASVPYLGHVKQLQEISFGGDIL
jgi:hypothetical protein